MAEQRKLSESDTKHWSPLEPVQNWVKSRIPKGARVLEIGPGHLPFPLADTFVGWLGSGENYVQCDIQESALPFADNEFDFVYCRHVLEDIYNPFLVSREMSRVAKAGYLETPSPMAEMCRGIDASSPLWRGYHHHRYFAWNDKGRLGFLTKYPIVEFIGDEKFEREITNLLRYHELFWNTYFLWENEISFKFYQHEVDYYIMVDYRELIMRAIEDSHAATNEIGQQLNKFMGSKSNHGR